MTAVSVHIHRDGKGKYSIHTTNAAALRKLLEATRDGDKLVKVEW